VLFCIVISAIGGAFTVTERSMREINQQYADVEQQYTDAAKRIEQVQKLQDKQRTMAHQAELTASLLEKVPRSKILAEITNGIPTGVSLIDFSMQSRLVHNTPASAGPKTAFQIRQAQVNGGATMVAGIPVAEPRVYDVAMRLSGVASTDVQVAQFIAKLNAAPMFQDVNLLVTEEWKDTAGATGDKGAKLRRFAIEMKLNPNYTVDSGSSTAATAGADSDGGTSTASLDNR
jgi:Tfp pilus assembly protein PilN